MERAEKVAVGPDREEQELPRLLKAALAGNSDREKINSSGQTDNINYEKLFAMAQAHQVLPLLYDVLETAAHEEVGEAPETAAHEENGEAPETAAHEEVGEAPECMVAWRTVWQQAARRTVSQNYHLLFTGKFLTVLLREADIPVALLKGTATSAYYPVPELRKSGDVDLYLLKEGDLPKARALFLAHGMTVKEEQHSLHHLVMQTAEGIVVELHTLIAEPFDNAAMNTCLEKCRELFAAHTEEKEIMGVTLPVLTGACHAYELLLHMLQHFLRAGFGLKLLCDWVVFWEKGVSGEEQQLYKKLIAESGLKGFSDVVTATCVEYLGLPEESVSFLKSNLKEDIAEVPGKGVQTAGDTLQEAFLRDVLDSEEFGKTSEDRMVAVRGSGFGAYTREFHHQMHLNFPQAGKCFLLWPLLWCMTLVRFLRNNRKIRHTSVRAVLRNAKARGELVKRLSLFEK